MNERLKIFFKLKLKEIWKALKCFVIGVVAIILGISLAVLIMYLLRVMFNLFPPVIKATLGYLFAICIFGLASFALLIVISDWIKGNWKKAG